MLKKYTVLSVIISLVAAVSTIAHSFHYDAVKYDASDPITVEKMKLLPVPQDFRNYFFLQAIDDKTYIVIGDFVGTDKVFCLIEDDKSDGKVDKVVQYQPDNNKYTNHIKPTSAFFTGYEETKKSILEGDIFKNNYAYNMSSLGMLKELLKRGEDIIKANQGYTVKLYDPDNPSTIMSEFYFNKRLNGRYDLVLKTNYYKVYRTKIVPAINCSVYARNSADPLIAGTVEELIKMVPQGITGP